MTIKSTVIGTSDSSRESSLYGKRVVVTRAAHQAGELVDLLAASGAESLLYPCIDIAPPESIAPLDVALQDLVNGGFDWLVLTSANTVTILLERLRALDLDTSVFAGLQVAVVGSSTAEAARIGLGVQVAVQPRHYHAEALALAIHPVRGARILLPLADIASPDLGNALSRMGADVHSVIAYRNIVGVGGVNVPLLLAEGAVDAVTFTSPSTVRNFIWRLVEEGGSTSSLSGIVLACIGPSTLKTTRECGLSGAVMPSEYTLDGLVRTLEGSFSC